MEGVASVVSAAPEQPRRSAAQSMLTAVLQPLAQAAQEPTATPGKAANGSAASSRSPNDLADVYLERLTVVMK